MTVDVLRDHMLRKKGVTEGFPFGEEVLVFKVMSRIFALVNLERVPLSVNLKCDPERAVELRERFEAVQPGYHMNKKHWNTVILDGTLSDPEMRDLVDHSYDLVARALGRAEREALAGL
jgi:predicted DNA-binding protein (MmcQ/YjbR family)